MTSPHADTPLAARHSRLADDLQAMRQKYPTPPKPVILSKYSSKKPKVDDSAKIRRNNIAAVLILLLVGYLLISGVVANIYLIFY